MKIVSCSLEFDFTGALPHDNGVLFMRKASRNPHVQRVVRVGSSDTIRVEFASEADQAACEAKLRRKHAHIDQ